MSRSRTYRARKPYGLENLVVDLALTLVTGGFWLLWVIVRPKRY